MKRRDFLKALALSPLAPSLLCAKEKTLSKFPMQPSFLGETRSFIYRGYYFTVQHILDSELEYIALHPFFEIQGIEAMFILTEQLEDLRRRNMFLDGMIRRWKKKQVYTTEELRGF